MSTPSPTPVPLVLDENKRQMKSENVSPKLGSGPNDLTPPPSPPQMQDSITVMSVDVQYQRAVWQWSQAYESDRAKLGFDTSPEENAILMTKRGHRKRKREDY